MIRMYCKFGHFIADVDINERGAIIPRGMRNPLRHGLTFDYAPSENLTRIHGRCFSRRCDYDGCLDYGELRDELIAAVAAGHTEYRMTR